MDIIRSHNEMINPSRRITESNQFISEKDSMDESNESDGEMDLERRNEKGERVNL